MHYHKDGPIMKCLPDHLIIVDGCKTCMYKFGVRLLHCLVSHETKQIFKSALREKRYHRKWWVTCPCSYAKEPVLLDPIEGT